MTAGAPGSSSFPAPSAVLIIDDESDHAAIIEIILAELAPSLPVRSLSRPELLQEQPDLIPDGTLILVDRMINGRESLDLLPGLRATHSGLTLALMSSALSEADRVRALAAGADFAVEKPGRLAGWRVLLTDLLQPRETPWSAAA